YYIYFSLFIDRDTHVFSGNRHHCYRKSHDTAFTIGGGQMDVLNQWVGQIIIFVLLATIVDLLIPATAMKKYIKLVVGLILILIFLKPVFHLFDMNIQKTLEDSYAQLDQDQGKLDNTEKLLEMQKKE